MQRALLPLGGMQQVGAMQLLEETQPKETLVPQAVPSEVAREEANAVVLVVEPQEVEAQELKEHSQALEEEVATALQVVRTAEGSSARWEVLQKQPEQDSAKQVDWENSSQEPGLEDELEQEDEACCRQHSHPGPTVRTNDEKTWPLSKTIWQKKQESLMQKTNSDPWASSEWGQRSPLH